MFCSRCGAQNPDGSNQCGSCGYVFAGSDNTVQMPDVSWKKEYKKTGKYIPGIIFGIILLAVLFPVNLLIFLGSLAPSSGETPDPDPSTMIAIAVIFGILTLLSLAGGLVLLLVSVKSKSKAERFNRELTELHKADLEAEKRQKAEQRKIEQQNRLDQAEQKKKSEQAFRSQGFKTELITGAIIFKLEGVFSTMEVYEDRVLLIAKTTARAYAAGKFFNGTKEFFYDDLTNIQFRETTKRFNGYLQFDYPGAINVSSSGFGGAGGNFSNENSFVYDTTILQGVTLLPREDKISAANRVAGEAYRYIHTKLVEEKKAKKGAYYQPAAPSRLSSADELQKYSELLRNGTITQEEFDEIKDKLLHT